MEENRIYISEEKTEYRMLPMNGGTVRGISMKRMPAA